jgi:hypothetical protein
MPLFPPYVAYRNPAVSRAFNASSFESLESATEFLHSGNLDGLDAADARFLTFKSQPQTLGLQNSKFIRLSSIFL